MNIARKRSTRAYAAAMASLLAIAVSGCSTISGDLSGAPRAGYQKDGSYILSVEEQRLGCRELQERSLGLQEQLKALPARAVQEMQELPQTVAGAWARLTGSADQGVPSLAAYNEAKAESVAVSASLERKGCGSIETATINR